MGYVWTWGWKERIHRNGGTWTFLTDKTPVKKGQESRVHISDEASSSIYHASYVTFPFLDNSLPTDTVIIFMLNYVCFDSSAFRFFLPFQPSCWWFKGIKQLRNCKCCSQTKPPVSVLKFLWKRSANPLFESWWKIDRKRETTEPPLSLDHFCLTLSFSQTKNPEVQPSLEWTRKKNETWYQ